MLGFCLPVGKILPENSCSIHKRFAHTTICFHKYSTFLLFHNIVDHKNVEYAKVYLLLVDHVLTTLFVGYFEYTHTMYNQLWFNNLNIPQ